MAYDGAQAIRKKIVGSHLRRLRMEVGMTVEEVASAMGMSRTSAYCQDSGSRRVSVADMHMYVKLYQVSDEKLVDHLMHLARNSSKSAWGKEFAGRVYPVQLEAAELEDMAVEVKSFEPVAVPGVLQTDGYAQALIGASAQSVRLPNLSPSKIIDLRTKRRANIFAKGPGNLEFIIGESAFCHMVGDEGVMREQMQYLASISRRNLATIRMLPFHVGLPAGSTFPFSLFVTCTDPFDGVLFFDIPFVEQFIGGKDEKDRISVAHDWFASLRKSAISKEDTLRYIEKRFC